MAPEPPESPPSAAPDVPPPHPLHVTRLLAEAASKSSVMWIQVPDGATYPVWFVWHDDGDPRGTGPALYVVSGPGEQNLPWLPEDVEVIFRSKDSGGRLLTTAAATREIDPQDPDWAAAVEVLRGERLNATGDLVARWRESATIHVLSRTADLSPRTPHRTSRRSSRSRAPPPRGAPGTGVVGPRRDAVPADRPAPRHSSSDTWIAIGVRRRDPARPDRPRRHTPIPLPT